MESVCAGTVLLSLLKQVSGDLKLFLVTDLLLSNTMTA